MQCAAADAPPASGRRYRGDEIRERKPRGSKCGLRSRISSPRPREARARQPCSPSLVLWLLFKKKRERSTTYVALSPLCVNAPWFTASALMRFRLRELRRCPW